MPTNRENIDPGDRKSDAKDKKQPGKWGWNSDNDDTGPGKIPPIFPPHINKDQFHFSIWYFVAAMLLVMILNTYVKEQIQEKIPYSVFKQKIESGEINVIQMKPDYYYGVSGEFSDEKVLHHKSLFIRQFLSKIPVL